MYYYTSPSVFSTSVNVSHPSPYINSVYMGEGATDYFAPSVYSFREWSKPQLSGKSIQKFDPVSSTYKPVTSETIEYEKLNSFIIPQVSIYKYLEFPMGDHNYPLTNGVYEKLFVTDVPYNYSTVFYLLDKTISCAIQKPRSRTTVTYDDAGNELSSTVSYYYDNLTHLNPTRTTTTTSDGKTIARYASFAQDYPAGTPFIDNLTARHIWNNPVEEVSVQTAGGVSKILAGKITTYNGSAVNQVLQMESPAPVELSGFKFSNRPAGSLPFTGPASAFAIDNRYAVKLTYSKYDSRNNPLTITPAFNSPVSYMWGYNKTYPLAEVKNAVDKDIFYTGFEEAEGNSTPGDAKAGALSFTGSYSKTMSGLGNGDYTLSYWQKSGSTWVLHTSKVAVANGEFAINLSGQIDEIRFYPVNAHMTTYTYTPLLGVTSQSDLNHRVTYYEYDDYKRLKLIRDQDRNIVKKYDYHTINPLFYNASRTVTLLKNDCDPTLYLGSSVNYTVNEFTYSSAISQVDADNKRDADILQKAQAFANAIGNCYNYKNYAKSQTFTRSCGSGLYGTSYTYTVPYGRHTALTPEGAEQKAVNDINANGQTSANNDPNGNCLTYAQLHKNIEMTQTFTKTCGFGLTADPVSYTVPAATYTSANSPEEANNQANLHLYLQGQALADQQTCNALPMQSIQVSNSTGYEMTITFSYSGGSTTYKAPSNQNYGTMSVVAGQTYSVTMTSPNSNTYKFYLGSTRKDGSSATFVNVQPASISITN